MGEADSRQKTRTKAIADFLRLECLPPSTLSRLAKPSTFPHKRRDAEHTNLTSAFGTTSLVIPSKTKETIPGTKDDDEVEVDDDDNNFVEEENIGSVASPYLKPNVYKKLFLDTQVW